MHPEPLAFEFEDLAPDETVACLWILVDQVGNLEWLHGVPPGTILRAVLVTVPVRTGVSGTTGGANPGASRSAYRRRRCSASAAHAVPVKNQKYQLNER